MSGTYEAAEAKRREFLELLYQGLRPPEACETMGIKLGTYKAWRSRDAFFAAECDSRTSGARKFKDEATATWESFVDFRFKFFGHVTPPHQAMIINAMEATKPGDVTMILVPPEHGKGLAGWTPIPTPRGWTTMADLKVDDVILAGDGTPTTVRYKSGLRRLTCYKVTFSDGSSMICDADHLWLTRTRKPQHGQSVKGIEEIRDTVTAHGRPNHAVPVGQALDLPARNDLTIDPYLLGVWLGDGATDAARISTADKEVLVAFEDAGYTVRHVSRYDYGITGEQRWSRDASFQGQLRSLGVLGHKKIPGKYLRGSYLQRLALLQGLMDSDGTCSPKGQCFFENTNKDLAEQTLELVRTLGIKARLYEGRAVLRGEDKGPKYRVSFYPRTPVFRLERKASRQLRNVDNDRDRWMTITAVEEFPTVDTYCIQVDHPSRLFLAGEQMVATHNTTIFEDWACFKLSLDPEWRFMVGCEAISLSTRILGRIKNRMDPKGPMRKWVEQFGPFAPQMATGQATRQTWAGTHFNVYKRTEFDERDYSMAAIGFGSNIIGSRTDHLHCDDLQSKKTINNTERMVETFQQDWLTRPGESGITTINGTRAGDGDFYEGLMTLWEGQPWFRIVKLPAIVTDHTTGESKPLWEHNPEMKSKNKGYTMEQLEKIKSKVGEEVWARSYMQNPRAQGLGTFIDDIIERCFNYERELYGPLPLDYAPIYIGLDPALGGVNCLMAWQITSEKMYLVDVQKAVNLQRNEDIMLQLELMLNRLKQRGGRVTEVVVETMNFQRGLARMDKFKELSEKWGFSTREHLTGNNKYSEDIGVASMPSDFISKRIDIPYAPEAFTREVAHRFRDELLRWRPGIKGSLLRQDEVMACLDVNTPLWTTSGWKTMGTVAVGDRVATAKGDTAVVLGKSKPKVSPVFKVTLGDGSELRADEGHRWWVEPQDVGGRRLEARWMTTGEMTEATENRSFRKISIRKPDPIETEEADLPIDPYVLGIWLGDGDASQGTISQDVKDMPILRAEIEGAGYEVVQHSRPTSIGVHGIRGHLSRLGVLGNKHIPDVYLNASSKQRLALLQGLMDTDGCVLPGAPRRGKSTFGNTNKALVDGVDFLALSLGFRTNVARQAPSTSANPQGGTSDTQEFWRVSFGADASTPCPFRYPRKAQHCYRELTRSMDWLTVRSIEPDGEAEVQCILIDHPSHVFLAGERLVPTGNTWFVWIKWQERRRSDVDSMNTKFQAAGLPWAPTETGLLIPTGRSPFYGGH